jgi:uncharacterized membrane protein
LVGIGLGSVGSDYHWFSPQNSQLGLGIGFIAIYLIDRLHKGKSHWWPLIPGLIISITALSQGALGLRRIFHIGWPIILILLGIWIIGKSTGIVKDEKKDDDDPLNKDKE